MVAPRRAVDFLGKPRYMTAIMQIDWQRVLLQAEGRHLLKFRQGPHRDIEKDTCGACLLEVLTEWEENL